MADANAPFPSPPTPPPQPAWRSIVAAVVRPRRALAATAVVAVLYLILAMDWVLFESLGVGRAACGDRCAVVAVADGVKTVAMSPGLSLLAPVCSICVARNTEADTAPAPNDLAPADQAVLFLLTVGMLASMAFVLVTIVGFLMKTFSPVNGSNLACCGSFVTDIGVLSLVLLNIFVVLPAIYGTVRVEEDVGAMAAHLRQKG